MAVDEEPREADRDRRAASRATEPDRDENTPGTNDSAEKVAATDSERDSANDGEGGGESETGSPFDPSSLVMFAASQMEPAQLAQLLIAVFDGHAWRALGLVAHPRTQQVERDLPAARLAIDVVEFLVNKTSGDMDATDRRDVQRRLNDLRVNYLNAQNQP